MKSKINKIIIEHLGVDPDQEYDDTTSLEDLGADSLDVVEIVMAIEEEFEIVINDEFDDLNTVEDIYNATMRCF